MRITFYGRLAESIAPQIELHVPLGASVADVRDRLAHEHPRASEALTAHRSRACIGGNLVSDDHRLAANDELEFLPPVSGG